MRGLIRIGGGATSCDLERRNFSQTGVKGVGLERGFESGIRVLFLDNGIGRNDDSAFHDHRKIRRHRRAADGLESDGGG